jgi:hypothetical protein
MVGIVADAQRLSRTNEGFAAIFDTVQSMFPEALRELKSSKILYGLGRWGKVDADRRKAIVEGICRWVGERKHRLALASLIHAGHKNAVEGIVPRELEDIWLAGAFHIALQLQKAHQGHKKNKGHTFLIFDENKAKNDHLPELLHSPPHWGDSFYEYSKGERLSQIIDSAFFVKSHHAGLVQVADLFAFLFRRYAELHDCGVEERFQGEGRLIDRYVEILQPALIPGSMRWPKKTNSESARWYVSRAPASLRALG